ncbi:hypothetical protein JQV27_14420 [Sulfitobacter mediterraneus]|uniref:hypothetical protein n=1 Tax=Sulfitobacter TaxID=60136 RepID=UPI0019341280|nr:MULTISPECIES: hypothetical protein [Sulfitobacter]MBM1633652.1 hypothetical protein [Sulfitobacter mediterraneus]MBM1641833.1 hypothetical protein [Sulfitobacter mediterraneus]MBM1645516.1 hypothetical protein [Sulfitobacter mediterraneus]MBM1649952.1 hypothetical protein [Sulfitobacter mediterraneus]MBM1653585.1 hypothetical protein [Sulfitobacter mediterraneus]
MTRYFAGLALVALLAGCAADNSPDSPIEAVQAAAYQAPGPKTLTIFTMVNNRTGSGGHTALMVNGSQRVIFDPAGSFRDPRVTERGDVLYGVTPGWLQAYKSAHARSTYHVVSQEFVVTPEQAEKALRLVQANGAVPGAFCANATTAILSQIEGFEGVKQTFYPVKLMEQIESFPGVRTTRLYENDEGDVIDAVKAGQLAQ